MTIILCVFVLQSVINECMNTLSLQRCQIVPARKLNWFFISSLPVMHRGALLRKKENISNINLSTQNKISKVTVHLPPAEQKQTADRLSDLPSDLLDSKNSMNSAFGLCALQLQDLIYAETEWNPQNEPGAARPHGATFTLPSVLKRPQRVWQLCLIILLQEMNLIYSVA